MSQNGQTHSNTHGNLPTNCLSVFDHFVGLALKELKKQYYKKQRCFIFVALLTLLTLIQVQND